MTAGLAKLAPLLAVASLAGGAAEPPTHAQLAVVVLPQSAFGHEAARLEVDIGAGYTTDADTADATLDPSDTARQIARAGRLAGYDLSFSDLSGGPLVRGRGLLYVDSSLDVFRSAAAADAFLVKQARDAQRLRGKRVELGVRLLASSSFPVTGLGDRAIGVRTTVAAGTLRFHDTLVGFRAGRLIAAVDVERADLRADDALALRLARALETRIRLAAAGTLRGQPTPVPPLSRKGVPPAGGLDLAAMALARADLPKGTRVSRQGYVDDDTTIGTYERELDTSGARSPADFVESDVSLFRHAKEAAGFLLAIRALYGSPYIREDLALEWGEPKVRLEGRPPVAAGDEAAALLVRAPGADGKLARVAIVHLRVGRVLGTLTVAGPAASLRLAHVQALAATFAKRIRDGL